MLRMSPGRSHHPRLPETSKIHQTNLIHTWSRWSRYCSRNDRTIKKMNRTTPMPKLPHTLVKTITSWITILITSIRRYVNSWISPTIITKTQLTPLIQGTAHKLIHMLSRNQFLNCKLSSPPWKWGKDPSTQLISDPYALIAGYRISEGHQSGKLVTQRQLEPCSQDISSPDVLTSS